ncbi:MAG: AMP-binding protein [Gammaproteobacteria bacterium]|nr:AMP-binding protein [Gammaproteobacteria bacterium]
MSRRIGRKALLERMRAQIDSRADRIAVRSSDGNATYADLSRLVDRLCRELRRPGRAQSGPVGVLLDRSAAAYAAMWAAIAVGRPYVPLSAKYPPARLRGIVAQAGVEVVICAASGRDLLARLGIAPEAAILAQTQISAGATGDAAVDWRASDTDEGIAYILFTSGSTGEPKGVPISYDNLQSFVENLDSVIDYRPEDVCTQFGELSFDLSTHEIYLALLNGCTLCPAREIDLFNPAGYVVDNGITVWVSGPSQARVALHNGLPVGQVLRTVRLSIFNGEALTDRLAREWQAAVDGSEIWNTYGPTEATVAVAALRWRDDPALSHAGVVSIGTAFADCVPALFVDDEIIPVCAERSDLIGELLLATPQRFDGYLDPGLPSPFVVDDGGLKYYRTGDRVLARGDLLFFVGRIDLQVKVRGHRIELLEVEHRLREFLGTDALAVVVHPPPPAISNQLILFLAGVREAPRFTGEDLGLPSHMVPRRCILLDSLPVTAHGKLDRDALGELVAADP